MQTLFVEGKDIGMLLSDLNSYITRIQDEKNLSVDITDALSAMRSFLDLIRNDSLAKIDESVQLINGVIKEPSQQIHQVFTEQMQVIGSAVKAIQHLRPALNSCYNVISAAGRLLSGTAPAIAMGNYLALLDFQLGRTLAARDKILTNVSVFLEPAPEIGHLQEPDDDCDDADDDLDLVCIRLPNGAGHSHVNGGDGQEKAGKTVDNATCGAQVVVGHVTESIL